jgi:hypothetical protein
MIPHVSFYIATYKNVQALRLMMKSRCDTRCTVKSVVRPVALAEVIILVNKHVTIQETPHQNKIRHGSLVTVDQNILGSKKCRPNRNQIPENWWEDKVQKYRFWRRKWKSNIKKSAGMTEIYIREKMYEECGSCSIIFGLWNGGVLSDSIFW